MSSYKREKAEEAAATDVSLGNTRAVALSLFPIGAAVVAAERGGDLGEAGKDLLAFGTSSDWPSMEKQ